MSHDAQFITWTTLHNEFGSGSYAVIDELVMVKTCSGQKATQLGGSTPEGIARILMREIAKHCPGSD
jgi:hypothetical protein